MGVRLPISGLLFFSLLQGSTPSDLDSLKTGLQFFKWKKVEVELNQIQYDQKYNSILSVSFIDSAAYLIASTEQDIFISGNDVKTFNQNTKQLIIDERLPGDKDVLSIMAGDLSGIILTDKRNENGLITFAFEMKDFGMSGIIAVKNDSWHFDNLHVDFDQDNWIGLKVLSWQMLRGSYSFSEFGIEALEVIDLRE
ncbi:MAG TPA: hypothetical protein DD389_04965 [Candidatus Marinimicrobia bacterium]|jgi:hypothetical protein|nr:hypothetical protein [Candidatus Neomarinimicrobiota bacterium]HJL74343.1 hypothetical protein [Candidatus Neomarinimicrobiota bacterium]